MASCEALSARDTCRSSGAEINDGIFAQVLERFERGIAARQRKCTERTLGMGIWAF
jgi:hypothetical protein